MIRGVAFLMVAGLVLAGDLRAAVAGAGKAFVSDNGRFAVEVKEPEAGKLRVTVLGVTNEVKTLVWSRTIKWERTVPTWAAAPECVEPLVTNDGETVVLRDDEPERTPNGLKILRRDGEEPQGLKLFDREDLTGMKNGPNDQKMRMGVGYRYVGSLFEFVLDEEESYAVWFGQTDQWVLISLRDGQERIVDDAETLARLNQMARQRALAIASEHQPPSYQRAFNKLRENVAKVVPALGGPARRRHMNEEATAAYLFLTARRIDSDRRWIEGLLKTPGPQVEHGHGMMERELEVRFAVSSGERLVGDFLLSRWKGETNREFFCRERMLLVPQDTYRYLGTIKVDLELPMAVPEDQPGALWGFLIPKEVPVGQWADEEEVLSFSAGLFYNKGRPEHLGPVGPKGELIFGGITPGEYRVKVVWERSPPAGRWQADRYVPAAGDYESAETRAVTVKAGETVTLINVACTNLLGGVKGDGTVR